MPVITAQPIQLSNTPPYRQAGGTNFGELNPFCLKIGSNLYWVAAQVQTNTTALRRIAVFKRAVSNSQGAWTDQPDGLDSANSPDIGHQSGRLEVFDDTVNTGKICILYLLDDLTSLKIVTFDVGTDTWDAPTSAVTVSNISSKFGFTRNNGGVFIVIGTRTGHLYYIHNTGGAWGPINDTSLAVTATVLAGGLIDAAGNSYVLLNESGFAMSIRHIDPTNVLSSAVQITANLATNAHRPGMTFFGATGIAVGWVPSSGGSHGDVIVSIAPVSTAPVFTDYDVYHSLGPFGNETHSYITPVLGADGSTLNVFFAAVDHDVPLDQLMQSTFDGVSVWTAPIVYYDEITNPPLNGVTPPGAATQFIHTLQAIELPQGWFVATAMETVNQGVPEGPPPTLWCTGEAMDPPAVNQTLQLNKVVVGGTASPSDFTLTAMGNNSPATVLTGPGPQVGPTPVPAITYDLSEAFGPTWNAATGTWDSNSTPWNGGYTPGAWVCTGGGSMPNDHTVIVPSGATIVCTITNTAPAPPPFNPTPCSGPNPPLPSTDTQFELRRVYASMKPAPRIPVRGGTG